MEGFANDLRDLESKFHLLGELAKNKHYTRNVRNVLLLAIKALHFSLERSRSQEFNAFLLNWPRKLTEQELARLREMGIEP